MDPRNTIRNESGNDPSDYLWDGVGEPDPEVQNLEALLGKYRHDRSAPAFPTLVSEKPWRFPLWPGRTFPVMATAAVLAIAIAGFLLYARKQRAGPRPGWDVSTLAGAPRIGSRIIRGDRAPTRLSVGQLLETDSQSRASLQAEGVGQIEMEPSTRLRLLTMGANLKQIALDRGTIHAFIWSPPGQFVVDTPSAMTVDLGCSYTLQVDDSGAGTVRTSLGWVGFKLNGRESFIPAGAACATRPKIGPGTPYFEDATADLRSALARFDFEDSTAQQRSDDLTVILAQARRRDTLTLWHLLSRVDAVQRPRVYLRLAALVPPPVGVTEDGVLRLDQSMLDQWWNALGFDDISIWRHWEHAWSGKEAFSREKQ